MVKGLASPEISCRGQHRVMLAWFSGGRREATFSESIHGVSG